MYRIGEDEIRAVERVIKSRELFRFNEGPREVEKFEDEWAKTVGTKHALCLTGGTAALICALVGLGIGPGDEVIVPAYTFMASALAVVAVSAIPVIAEVDESLTLDPEDVEKKISKYTKAIMPVNMLGMPTDMDKIMALAKKYDLKVIEDCCQADGGSYKGKRLGSIGDVGAFSFNFYKIISAGEGGAVVTDDDTVHERALIYHDGGSAFRANANKLKTPVFCGAQLRTNEIIGAILREQLKKLDFILADLRKNKKALMMLLEGGKNIGFIRSNDIEGDCGSNMGLLFETKEKAEAFAANIDSSTLVNSKKHVYFDWDPIMNKRGSHSPLLDPFKMELNKDLNMNYTKDMCPKSIDILQRTVIIGINPEWDEEDVRNKAGSILKAAESI